MPNLGLERPRDDVVRGYPPGRWHPGAVQGHRDHVQRGAADLALLDLARSWQPHLVVADAELVDPDLLSAVQPITSEVRSVPIVAVTASPEESSRVSAFEAGADDALSLPLRAEELLARIRALLRRTYSAFTPFGRPVQIGDLRIDVAERSVWLGDAALELPPLDCALLYLLAAHAGSVVTREEILDALWGPDEVPGSNVVEVAIRRLRVHLGDDWRTPRFIATVSGRGYRLVPAADGAAARCAFPLLAD